MSAVMKFKYLVSLVTGPVARAIDGLDITDSNYATTVDILQKCFGKRELLVNQHLDSLCNLKAV